MNRLPATSRQFRTSAARVCAAAGLALLLSASGPWCQVFAQAAGCTEACKAAFGACYKKTANRPLCEQQMQHCLDACISSKHG